jgi:6-pyruvoyl-tetrahydropterin synthase
MEKIIYLEADEEITSVVDRVKNAQSRAIALVVPRGASIIQGIVNLKLLRREADKIKKEICLVTTDKAAKNLALQVGIPVFDKLDEAISAMPEMDEETTEPEIETSTVEPKTSGEKTIPISEIKYRKVAQIKPQPHAPISNFQSPKRSFKFSWKYALGIFVFLVLAGAFTAFFLLPKATIALTLNSETLDHQFRITVDQSQKKYSPEENVIPGAIVTTTKEIAQKGEATGEKDVGEAAKGTITVFNSWSSESQSFPAGTKFKSSSGRIYVSSSAFTIPALKYEGKVYPGSVNVNAVAIEKGGQYNGKTGTMIITSLSSIQQSKIYGQGSNFSGGFEKQITVVSKNDVEKIKKQVNSQISDALTNEVASKVSEDSTYVKESVIKDVIKDEVSPAIDKEAKDFEVKMEVKISVMTYKNKDFDAITDQNIQKALNGRTLILDAYKEITTRLIKQDLKTGKLTLDLNAKAQIGPEFNEKVLRENLSGKNEIDALSYLKSFKEVKDAQVSLWPFWVKKIPGLEASVKIKIDYVAQATNGSQNSQTSQKE